MGKLSNNTQQTLPEFQKFLLERKLVPAKNAPFFAYWVSRLLDFAGKRNLSAMEYKESVVIEFFDLLIRIQAGCRRLQPMLLDEAA